MKPFLISFVLLFSINLAFSQARIARKASSLVIKKVGQVLNKNTRSVEQKAVQVIDKYANTALQHFSHQTTKITLNKLKKYMKHMNVFGIHNIYVLRLFQCFMSPIVLQMEIVEDQHNILTNVHEY